MSASSYDNGIVIGFVGGKDYVSQDNGDGTYSLICPIGNVPEIKRSRDRMIEENQQLQKDKAELVEALKALVKVEHERGGTLGVSGSFNYPVPEGVFIKAKKLLEKHK